jgi:hypothetical protein
LTTKPVVPRHAARFRDRDRGVLASIEEPALILHILAHLLTAETKVKYSPFDARTAAAAAAMNPRIGVLNAPSALPAMACNIDCVKVAG